MAEVVLFHHAQGLTDGVRALADDLSSAGHLVHLPDLYEGRTFGDLSDGIAHAEGVGFDVILERGRRAADVLPARLVYVGLSLGVLPAQMLAQTRGGARGAVFCSACVAPSEFDGPWPHGVPVQVHMMERDRLVVEEGDLDVARGLASGADGAELFLYQGDRHLFVDRSLSDYDDAAAALFTQRVLAFLDGLA